MPEGEGSWWLSVSGVTCHSAGAQLVVACRFGCSQIKQQQGVEMGRLTTGHHTTTHHTIILLGAGIGVCIIYRP